MIMAPLFSIVLPTYNRGYVLWRAIQSVLAQSEFRWELIVVDDGAYSDDTSRLLEEFHDSRIRFIKTTNNGPSGARNIGGQLATAPYLAYLDSDNTWHPEFLATMLHSIQSNPTGVLWYCGQNTSYWRRANNGSWTLEKLEAEPRAQYSLNEALQLKGADTNCIVHAKSLLAEIGGWDEQCRWLEDWDFLARAMLRYPTRLHWVAKILVEYRQVHGADVDGICATTVQNRDDNMTGWKYIIDKWSSQPGFAETAHRLTAKHLSNVKSS
jgi:glycosyltransferase involved in cell wall biosynthesis